MRIDLSYGYLDSEINDVEGDDANLYHLPNAPENMLAATLDWQIVQLAAGDLSLAVDYSWQDDSVTGVRELVGIDVDSYDLASARLQLAGQNWVGKGDFRVAAWVRNMFDEEYYVDTFGSFNTLHANRVATYGDPRTWGVDVQYSF